MQDVFQVNRLNFHRTPAAVVTILHSTIQQLYVMSLAFVFQLLHQVVNVMDI